MPNLSAQIAGYNPLDAMSAISQGEKRYDVYGARDRVQGLRSLVGNLQSAVEAVDPSVTGRTSGNFTTEGQRSALVSKEQAPILGDLYKQQSVLGREEAGLADSQGLASQMASALMAQDSQRYQGLLDRYNAKIARDQSAEQRRQYRQTFAEQRRQFDANLAAQNAEREANKAQPLELQKIIDQIMSQYATDLDGYGAFERTMQQAEQAPSYITSLDKQRQTKGTYVTPKGVENVYLAGY